MIAQIFLFSHIETDADVWYMYTVAFDSVPGFTGDVLFD